MEIFISVLIFILGVVIGLLLYSGYVRRRFVGIIRVDKSDPSDAPYLFLELRKSVQDVEASKYVILQVKVENFVKQEKE